MPQDRDLIRRHYEVRSGRWPSDKAPLNIAFLSDFHVGCPSVDLERLRTIVGQANALTPDIILLGGDFLSKKIPRGTYVPPAPIADVLRGLSAPMGVYAVLGNHDWRMDGTGMTAALQDAGITVLENAAVKIPDASLWVAGLADHTTRMPDYAHTIAQVSDDDPVILLSHDPKGFAQIDDRPVVTLSGHTHGGQVRLPLIGPVILPGKVPRKYAYGHIVENGRDLIVTGGIGESIFPLRFGMLSEIVIVSIQSHSR